MKKFAFSLLAFLLVVPATQAVTVTASEYISDAFDGDQRDFVRTRQSTSGIFDVEDNDATIIADNLLSAAFGVLSLSDVSYRHDVTWLNPAPGTFISATLTISGLLNLGGDEEVYIDTFSIGALNNGALSTTPFSLVPAVSLAAVFADGYLDVFINKNQGANFPANFNFSTIYASNLEVTYEEVPEPATAALLGAGLLGGAIKRRRKKA